MKKIIVISDFDGTITTDDTLVGILNKFASPQWHKIEKLILQGKFGTRIGLKKEFDFCRITKRQFIDYLLKHTRIDPAFKKFVEFCKKNRLRFVVVSGGFGLNIKAVFKKFNIKGVPYYANTITFNKATPKITFNVKNKICRNCGHCKSHYLKWFKKTGLFTIYIGDGITDLCAVENADLVFAKHHLAKYCREKGISYIPYKTFGNIKNYITSRFFSKAPLFPS